MGQLPHLWPSGRDGADGPGIKPRASYPGFRRRRPPQFRDGLSPDWSPPCGLQMVDRRGVERPRSSRSGPEARTRRRNLGPAHAGDERRRGSAKFSPPARRWRPWFAPCPMMTLDCSPRCRQLPAVVSQTPTTLRGRVARAVSDQILDQKRKSSQWRLHKLASTGLAESSAESLIQYGVERGIDPLGPLDSGSHQFRRHLPAPDRPSLADCVHPRKVVRQRGAPLLVGLCGHRARPAEAPKKGAFRGRLSWHRCTGGDVHVIVPGTLPVGTPTGRPTVQTVYRAGRRRRPWRASRDDAWRCRGSGVVG